ncbi:MAG TPA: hypothetical protein VF268_13470 [Gammaproteobacteria bacterium]
MVKTSTGLLVVIAVAVITGLIIFHYPVPQDTIPEAPVSAPVVRDTAPEEPIAPASQPSVEAEVVEKENPDEDGQVVLMEEQPVLGSFVRVRAVREQTDDSQPGAVRDLEFLFRPGVLPRRLFENTDNVILRYDQLFKNDVGAGAAAIRFYYEVVTTDTNGDGMLSGEDAFDIGVSYIDGSGYTTLASNVESVLVYEQSAGGLELQLTLQLAGDELVKRVYSLESNTLLSEQRIQYD